MDQETSPKSLPALVVGAFLSMLISAALVIATAKAGISPGVSPLVVLIGWVVFGSLMKDRLKPFLAILQVTGSGGAAVSAGLIFTAPIIQIAAKVLGEPVPKVDVLTTMLACFAGSLLGWGFVGLATRRFLTDPRLPAPEAVACDQLIQTASQNPEERPPVTLSLLPALISGFTIRMLVFLEWIKETTFTASIPLPSMAPENNLKLPVPVSPLYLGIGALLTFPTAILVFAGGLVNSITNAVVAERGLPSETFRWVGGAAMVVAVVYSLINYVIEGRKVRLAAVANSNDALVDEDLLVISSGMRMGLISAIVAGTVLLMTILVRSGMPMTQVVVLGIVSFVLISLLSGLGGLLSLQVGASASPVSGTVFMAMLVLSLTAIGLSQSGFGAIQNLQPVLIAACIAIAAANDSSQDYKTLQLNGFSVQSGFVGQLVGCLAGAITVPIALWIADEAFGLGTEALPCPQAGFFGTVLTSLFDPQRGVPWGPVCVGALLGLVAVTIEYVGKRNGLILSSLAFAVGVYLPAEMAIGILCGNLARVIATRSLTNSSHRGILGAAGLIAGDSMLSLIAGVLIVCQVDLGQLTAKVSWPTTVGSIALVVVLVFLGYVYWDSRNSKRSSA